MHPYWATSTASEETNIPLLYWLILILDGDVKAYSYIICFLNSVFSSLFENPTACYVMTLDGFLLLGKKCIIKLVLKKISLINFMMVV